LRNGREVLLFDNLSRGGSERNLEWLRSRHGRRVRVRRADIRDRSAVKDALSNAGFVFHLAAQVAVTRSLAEPASDFEVNVLGTLGLLEEMRQMAEAPGLIFASTNKIYGALDHLQVHALWNRYEPDDMATARGGINEKCPLDFQSPYGCSKGAADQYVLEYARSFRIPAAVFRMSCIYGPRQFGTEDQGWLAHFLIRAIRQEPLTIYGDGKQVRDVLYIDDLVAAFSAAMENIGRVSGAAYNIGGGPQNTVSLRELLRLIRHFNGTVPVTEYADWRKGDQRYYVSDTAKFRALTGWEPKVGVQEGVGMLHGWCVEEGAGVVAQVA
jgi:CDP-paratose 2-epimerase